VGLSTALAQVPSADATRLLYEQHSSRIFGFCLSRLGSREEAEDAVQTTFLNAQRGLGRGVVPEYELAWLFKIAQNVCHNRHQSARRRGRVEATQDLDALQDVIASPDRSAAVSLGELTGALGAIPTRQRRALLLREFQGYSYEEIANDLGISVAAVETLLFRARRAVAQQLAQPGATSRSRRGAAASLVELFRWLFGGSAPLKLAAVTAAVVATAATVSIVPLVGDHKPAPVAPAVAKAGSGLVVPAGKAPRANVALSLVRPATFPAASVQSSTPTISVPLAPEVHPAAPRTETPLGASSPPLETATKNLPTLIIPDLPAPKVPLATVSAADLPLPAIGLPAVQVALPPIPPKLP
jgi:RNA polymerase sigma-70 factor (ECF subfamily)